VWGDVEGKVTGVVSSIKRSLSSFATWVSGFAHGALTVAVNAVTKVLDNIGEAGEKAYKAVKSAIGKIPGAISGLVHDIGKAAGDAASAIKTPINSVITAWNNLQFPRVSIKIPSIKILKKKIGGGSFAFGPYDLPDFPTKLAKGGVVTDPTLALIGESGPEAVVPLDRMQPNVEVRVFIGATELTDIVRTEIVESNTGLARTLLAGIG
jgi:hypothetical protein